MLFPSKNLLKAKILYVKKIIILFKKECNVLIDIHVEWFYFVVSNCKIPMTMYVNSSTYLHTVAIGLHQALVEKKRGKSLLYL